MTDKNKCLLCNKIGDMQFHEIFYGKGLRKISIEYNLRIPLCCEHHLNVVHKEKKKYQIIICGMTGLDYAEINRIMNKAKKEWSPAEKIIMEGVRDYMNSWHETRQKYVERLNEL